MILDSLITGFKHAITFACWGAGFAAGLAFLIGWIAAAMYAVEFVKAKRATRP